MKAIECAVRALLVDDHPMVRSGIKAALCLHFPGIEVQESICAAEALERIRDRPPEVALLDVGLPGMNGLDLARAIKASFPTVHVLMVAGEVDPWTVHEALEAGSSGFVAKASPDSVLAEAVSAVLAGSVFLCPDSRAALGRAESTPTISDTPPPAILSRREREILVHIAHGENTKSIALTLGISAKTVETHRQHIMRKLRTDSVARLVRYAIHHHLIRC
ncbi:MAG: response regulator [Limisphaerales bacterium]